MRYALITTDGELHVKDANWPGIRAEVGPEGPAGVALPPVMPIAAPWFRGWVNDVGHTRPEVYPRNVIGSLVLIGLGAATWPYAGPVVITGWDPNPYTDGPETRGLDDVQAEVIDAIHQDAADALAGKAGEVFEIARTVAEWVRTCPTPALTVSFPAGGRHGTA
ncbi:hypothetical protein AB0395_26390 [Streptosporangium sp. NPDC051023]|uniref:hypothetical protein n=1 Tax=Streptosporangium sp. NPDC051023 TaxID=3155410 RepID=UPI00344E2CB6